MKLRLRRRRRPPITQKTVEELERGGAWETARIARRFLKKF